MAVSLHRLLARVALPRVARRAFAGYVNSVTELIGATPMVKPGEGPTRGNSRTRAVEREELARAARRGARTSRAALVFDII